MLQERVGSPGAETIRCCEILNMGTGNQTSSVKAVPRFNG